VTRARERYEVRNAARPHRGRGDGDPGLGSLAVDVRKAASDGLVLDELVEDQPETDRRQLRGVTHEQQAAARAEPLHQRVHAGQVHHRGFVEHDKGGIGDSAETFQLRFGLGRIAFRRLRIGEDGLDLIAFGELRQRSGDGLGQTAGCP
jgi:hypothetical protein